MNDTASQSAYKKGSAAAYVIGFLLSLGLTLAAYLLVRRHVNSHHLFLSDAIMLAAVSSLAVTQLLVQLIFFLHLDRESKPWWNNTALAFAASVVLILVFGSLWIMSSLNYHHAGNKTHDGHPLTTPGQTNNYIIQDEGIKP